MPDKPRPILSESRLRLLLVLPLAVLALALFWPATGFDFVKLDDDQYICLNPHVLTGLSPANVRWAFTTVHEQWWLPLLWISYMVDTELFGTGPFGYHLTNVLLHAVNAALLFWVLCRLTGSRWRSFFVAAFFALHPLRVESVAWIAERKDGLSGLFFLLALLAYVRQVERPGGTRRATLCGWMLLGLLSKAILVVLPFLLLLLDYWPRRRAGDPWIRGAWTKWRPLLLEKLPLFLLSAVFIFINWHTHVAASGAQESVSLWHRAALIAPNYWSYLGKIAWPAQLALIYPPHDAVTMPGAVAGAAGLLAVTVLLIRWRSQAPWAVTGWLWFLLALFPVIRGVRLDPTVAMADRFTYLPSIGLGLALVWSLAALVEKRPSWKIPAVALGVALLLACAARTALRLPAWKDSLTMFSELVEFAPDNFTANSAYGFALLEKGHAEESLVYFARAAELKPKETQAPADYADALLRLGRTEEAVAWLQTALAERNPACPALNSLLAFAYLDADRAERAVAPLRKALESQPGHLGWRIELIRALFEAGQAGAAQEEIRRLQADGYAGIRSFDDLIPQYVNWWSGGEKNHAWHFFRNAISNQPDHILLLNAAAWLLATDPAPPADPQEALRFAQRAAELSPEPHPLLLDTLAAAFAANGRFEEARQTAGQARDLAAKQGDIASQMKIEARLAAYRQNQPWRETP
jgi:tetratricopeptide (TPR) repeat protein